VASTLDDTRRVADIAKPLMRNVDVVHEWYSLYGMAGLRLARRFRKPFVLEVDALLIEEYTGLQGVRLGRVRLSGARACLRANLEAAVRIIVRSRVMADVLIRDWSVSPAKVAVIPCALDLDKFRRLESANAGTVDQMIVFLGSLQPWHGCDVLLEAFAELVRDGVKAKLSIIGDGKQKMKLIERSVQLGLEGHVLFHGMVSHERIPAMLTQATVTVAPYPELSVPFYFSPMKMFEYMGAKTAIVASSIGQLAEVLTDGESALLVHPGNVAQLALAMRKLLEDPALRKRLAERARLLADDYTYPRQAEAIRDVYRQALEATA
jgi:glycosyltransferase involved in cell wall biosynthesis